MSDDTNTDDDESTPIADAVGELERMAQSFGEEIRDGIEKAEKKREREQTPFESHVERIRKRTEPFNIEDEIDRIRDDLGIDTDSGSRRFERPPAEGRHCPCCGEDLEADDTEWIPDELLNRYRTFINCPNCRFRGEVIRHGAAEDPR